MDSVPNEGTPAKQSYYERNKELVNRRTVAHIKKQKTRRRSLLHSSCFCCGDPDDQVIQWHHVDESTKLFEIFGGTGCSAAEERWWNEVLKCIPVCANCHIKIHKQLLCLLPQKLLTKNLHL